MSQFWNYFVYMTKVQNKNISVISFIIIKTAYVGNSDCVKAEY